ncbi:MAG: SIS domain-containing protein [bacterium]
MDNVENIKSIINERIRQKELLVESAEDISEAVDCIVQTYNNGGKVLIAGNGGSAADSQHIAGEFVGRFLKNRRPLPAIALSTDTSVITAVANDMGYHEIFARQIKAIAGKNDTVILISTSGSSPNILKALESACSIGCKVITLACLKDNEISDKGHINIRVPGNTSPEIQENHSTVYHILCEMVEQQLF